MWRIFPALALAGALFAQTPEFAAVSIKVNKSGDLPFGIRPSAGGRLTATNVPVGALVAWAYRLWGEQLVGAPDIRSAERYDVVATSEGDPKYDRDHPELQIMFQKVLADRFKLTFHRETRDLPVYALVVTKHGPKIQPTEEGTSSVRATGFAKMSVQHGSMSAIVSLLGGEAGRMVIDKTELTGSYTFDLDWKKYIAPLERPGVDPSELRRAFDSSSVPQAISDALEAQLGLKLELQKAPVEVLVIDHVERPSEN
jgi:uncharacterized protein (TIGR03435 family)